MNELVIKVGLIFYISSLIGYIYELILTYINTGKIFSHGFLKGPWLPIYGFGAVFLSLLQKYQKEPLKVFILSFLITGFFEYLSGLFLLKVFKMRLWDYTGHFLNINGFVCLLSASIFGASGLLTVYGLCPLIEKVMKKGNLKTYQNGLILTSILFLDDIFKRTLQHL